MNPDLTSVHQKEKEGAVWRSWWRSIGWRVRLYQKKGNSDEGYFSFLKRAIYPFCSQFKRGTQNNNGGKGAFYSSRQFATRPWTTLASTSMRRSPTRFSELTVGFKMRVLTIGETSTPRRILSVVSSPSKISVPTSVLILMVILIPRSSKS